MERLGWLRARYNGSLYIGDSDALIPDGSKSSTHVTRMALLGPEPAGVIAPPVRSKNFHTVRLHTRRPPVRPLDRTPEKRARR